MEKKKGSMSLFIYTGLIFSVAVVLILIAFFGQSNLEKSREEYVQTQAQTNSITQRASALSEENMALLEKSKQQQTTIDEQSKKIDELNKQITDISNTHKNSDKLYAANGFVSKKMNKEALAILNEIDESTLTADQKILYDTLSKRVGKD